MGTVAFTQGNKVIGLLLPTGNLYTTKPFTRLLGEYGLYIKTLHTQVAVENLANGSSQTVDLNDPIQVEAYQNQ
jgi:hypothetical protein